MPVEYTVGREPEELRCPRCRVFVGHAQEPMEAPLCADCVRLAPVLEQLAEIKARLLALEANTTGMVMHLPKP